MENEPRPSFYTPLRYPGGKGKLVPYIKKILESNELVDGVYVEPYAGGAAVAMELVLQEYCKKVYINDISAGVAAFWRAVLDHTDELSAKIRDVAVTVEEWQRQKQIQLSPNSYNDLDLGFSTFFLNRTNRSGILAAGIIGGKQQHGKWKIDARYTKDDLVRRVHAIGRVRERIEFSQLDAIEFLSRVAPRLPSRSLIYLDPPYYVKGSNLYLHHYHHDDHLRVSKRVAKLGRKNWIVSYDNAEPIHNMYAGFRRIEYGLSYSAQDRYKGSEAMFFSHALNIPEAVRPMHITGRGAEAMAS